jgi:hypothetical protein
MEIAKLQTDEERDPDESGVRERVLPHLSDDLHDILGALAVVVINVEFLAARSTARDAEAEVDEVTDEVRRSLDRITKIVRGMQCDAQAKKAA